MSRILRIARLFALLSLLSGGAAAGDKEILKEFSKYFRKYKDTPTRVEAIRALEESPSPGVVRALVPILKDKEPQVVAAAVGVLGKMQTRESVDEIFASLESAKAEPIQLGLLQVIRASAPSEGAEFVLPALESRSWLVRWRAIEAVVAIGGAEAVAAVLPLVTDSEAGVRCAALDGLAQLKSPAVLEPALEALGDESWQVRASAIAALGKVRDKKSIAPLIARMEREEGRLAADIGVALSELTGRSFGVRRDAWLKWWRSIENRFELPTDAEMMRLAKRRAEIAEEYTPSKQVAYHGIDTPSRRLLFVIDVSGSMENLVIDPEPFKDGGYPSFSRMDIVKTELQRTVEGLESYVEFNMLSFATDLKPWKKKLVKANVLNKSSAGSWAKRLEPLGGRSRDHLAEVGLAGSANLEAGKTNSYGALMWALGVDGKRGTEEYEIDIDTIFFLSDGRPSHGTYVHEGDILARVREANALRKVVIHTIAIGRFQKVFMQELARENGGVFVDLEPE